MNDAMEMPKSEHHGRDHLITGIGLIAEFAAGKYGISLLAWLGAIFLFLAFLSYTKKFLSTKNGLYRYGACGTGVMVIVVATLFVTGVFRFGKKREEAAAIPAPVISPRPSPPALPPQTEKSTSSANTKKSKRSAPRSVQNEQHGDNNGAVGGNITQGPCSNLQVGGSNNQASTNCVVYRSLSEQEKGSLVESLRNGDKTTVTIWSVEDGEVLANDLYKCLKDAGWNMQDSQVTMMLAPNPEPGDVGIFIPGDPGDHSDAHNAPLAHLIRSLAPLKTHLKIDWARSDKIEGKVIKIVVFPPTS